MGRGGSGKFSPESCLSRLPHNEIMNGAVPGTNTAEMFENTKKHSSILSDSYIRPNLVFISIGGIDAITNFQFPGVYPVEKSIQELSNSLRMFEITSSALVVYLKITPPYDKKASDHLKKVADYAATRGVLVIDGMRGLWKNEFLKDQFHPNDKGYEIMCDRLISEISKYYP